MVDILDNLGNRETSLQDSFFVGYVNFPQSALNFDGAYVWIFVICYYCSVCHYCLFSCYFTDHSESLHFTTNLSLSTFNNGQRKATVLVSSLYLGLAPELIRLQPLFCFNFSISFYPYFCTARKWFIF